MDRGIKDEGFVRYALEIAENEDGRWLANQSFFNHQDTNPIDSRLKSVLVTAVAIYANKFHWSESVVTDALSISTLGDARTLIDRLSPKIPPRS
jgi:hypothetical protein